MMMGGRRGKSTLVIDFWWVAFLDVYGFSSIVAECSKKGAQAALNGRRSEAATYQPLADVHQRLKEAIDEGRRRLSTSYPSTATLAVSDCIFLVAPIATTDSTAAVNSMIAAINSTCVVLTAFTTYDFIMRGGVACGPGVFFDKATGTLLGAPVLRAVAYEKALPPPLVWLPEKELLSVDERVSSDVSRTLFKDAPTIAETRDGGLLSTRVILPLEEDAFRLRVGELYLEHVVRGVDTVARSLRDALSILDELNTRKIRTTPK
jgi:hypothetical protein